MFVLNLRNSYLPIVSMIALAMSSQMVLSGCRGNIATNNEKLSEVEYADKGAAGNTATAAPQTSFQQNMAEEQAVADGVLKAWRKAVAGDEATAMKELEEIDAKHPSISTVQFMMGQVKEHFGKHDEAVEHFRKAHSVNEFSSMQTFKLAESMRKAGDAKGSIVYYKKLIANLERATSDFGRDHLNELLASVRVGYGKALKDTGDLKTAIEQSKKAVELAPMNKDAKEFFDEIGAGKQSSPPTPAPANAK